MTDVRHVGRRWAALLAGILPSLCFHRVAMAAGPTVLVESAPDDPVAIRIGAELRSAGFVVTVLASTEHESDEAPGTQSDAVVRLETDSVQVWLVQGDPKRAVEIEELDRQLGDEGPALRAAEVVRARLLPVPPLAESSPVTFGPAGDVGSANAIPTDAVVRVVPLPSPPEGASSARTPETARAPARFSLGIGAILLASPGGVPTGFDVVVSPVWTATSRLSVRGSLAIPVASPSVTAVEGSASVGAWIAGLGVDVRLTSLDTPWVGTVGAAVNAAWLHLQGSANSPYVSATDSPVTCLPDVDASLARTLLPNLRIGVQGRMGAAFPEVGVRFADREVAHWGRPLVGASLVLEADILR